MSQRPPAYLSAHASFLGFAALAIGLADAALIATGRLGAAGAFQYVPSRVWLVAPLCWAALAIAIWAPCYVLIRRNGGIAAAILSMLLFGALRLAGKPYRLLVVGAAITIAGAAIAWWAARRWTSSPRPLAAAAVAVAWASLAAASATSGGGGGTARPSQHAATPAPDVVVVFLDTVRYDSIFRQGSGVPPELPFFAKMASESVVYDRAYSTSPWTLPAHFSAVTGLAAHKLGVSFDDQRYDGQAPTMAERFRRRGYRTAAVISNTFLNRDTGFSRGFDAFEHASTALDVCRTAPGSVLERWWPWFAASVCNWTASEVTGRAIAHVRDTPQPLFLLLNYMDAHDPYYVERPCERPPGEIPLPLEVAPHEYGTRYRASHLAAVRCIDRHLGALSAELERRKREAVFVVLADHGEHFGEHGLVRHGNSLYTQLLHVPFMIRAPRLAPRRVREPVSIASMSRLVLNVIDRHDVADGTTHALSALFPPAALPADEQWSLVAGRWHLIRRSDGGHELYDVATDPAEERNLAGAPRLAPVVRELSTHLDRESRGRVDPRLGGFRSLGYIR